MSRGATGISGGASIIAPAYLGATREISSNARTAALRRGLARFFQLLALDALDGVRRLAGLFLHEPFVFGELMLFLLVFPGRNVIAFALHLSVRAGRRAARVGLRHALVVHGGLLRGMHGGERKRRAGVPIQPAAPILLLLSPG